MNHPLPLRLLLAASFALAIGCTPNTEKTIENNTTTVTVIQECGAGAPNGKCDAGKTCFEGACVDGASLCSPTNDTGTCTAGTTCFGGGCVVATFLCSATSPNGPCSMGKSCLNGTCTDLSTMCSTANPTGTCPTGQTCQAGICAGVTVEACAQQIYTEQPVIGVRSRAILTIDGKQFKDSNGNGTLDVFEDWRLNETCRARDLLTKMSVNEKIGLMGEGSTIGSGTTDGVLPASAITNIKDVKLRQALIRFGNLSSSALATYLNNVQELCESEPNAIPFIVTADPVHGMGMATNATTGIMTAITTAAVTPWPYPMGLGAANDITLTRAYGDAVRREFKALGFRWQLGPMADVATEPRWARVQNTFGENAHAVGNHARACVEGFQGDGKGGLKNGIAATIKHFPGAGAAEGGKDSHSRPGRYNVFPGGYFVYHQIAFKNAFTAKPAAVMPCYSIFKGQLDWEPEQTGSIYSHSLITEYMKTELGFSGLVTSDWGTLGNTAWGVEALTPAQRAALFLQAGAHQAGSDSTNIFRDSFAQGLITEAQIDAAGEKVLEISFRLGMFENPYVDPAAATAEVRSIANRTEGFIAQKKAIVILKNREHTTTANTGAKYMPIDGARRNTDGGVTNDTNGNGSVEVFFDGMTDSLAGSDIYDDAFQPYDYKSAVGTTADGGVSIAVTEATSAATADIAVLRITARKGTYMGLDKGVPLSFDAPFTGTSTDANYAAAVKDAQKVIDLLRIRDGYTNSLGVAIPAANPSLKIIVVMHMDRPGIVKPIVNGLTTLNETLGVAGSYPLFSNPANVSTTGLVGVDAFLVDFGAYDRAVLDVLFNKNVPATAAGVTPVYVYGSSRLPIEIPSGDAEVDAQFEDMPADSINPTYNLGAGQTY